MNSQSHIFFLHLPFSPIVDAHLLCLEGASKVGPAPSREDISLRAYTARRRLNRLRRGACMVFQSEPVIRVMQKLEAEVEKGRIVVRSDKMLHADLGKKIHSVSSSL